MMGMICVTHRNTTHPTPAGLATLHSSWGKRHQISILQRKFTSGIFFFFLFFFFFWRYTCHHHVRIISYGAFPKIGLPPVIYFPDGIFPNKNHPAIGVPPMTPWRGGTSSSEQARDVKTLPCWRRDTPNPPCGHWGGSIKVLHFAIQTWVCCVQYFLVI